MNVTSDAPGKVYKKNIKTTSVTQTLNVLNISTSKTHNVLVMRTNTMFAMNKGLNCSENIDNILFNPNQVRNDGIEY